MGALGPRSDRIGEILSASIRWVLTTRIIFQEANMANGTLRVGNIILIPSIITLAVTLLRLTGELRQWNETFFRRSAAIVGIAWLAVIFASGTVPGSGSLGSEGSGPDRHSGYMPCPPWRGAVCACRPEHDRRWSFQESAR